MPKVKGEPSKKKTKGTGYIEGRPFLSIKNEWCRPNGGTEIPERTAKEPEEESNPVEDIITIEDLLELDEKEEEELSLPFSLLTPRSGSPATTPTSSRTLKTTGRVTPYKKSCQVKNDITVTISPAGRKVDRSAMTSTSSSSASSSSASSSTKKTEPSAIKGLTPFVQGLVYSLVHCNQCGRSCGCKSYGSLFPKDFVHRRNKFLSKIQKSDKLRKSTLWLS